MTGLPAHVSLSLTHGLYYKITINALLPCNIYDTVILIFYLFLIHIYLLILKLNTLNNPPEYLALSIS